MEISNLSSLVQFDLPWLHIFTCEQKNDIFTCEQKNHIFACEQNNYIFTCEHKNDIYTVRYCMISTLFFYIFMWRWRHHVYFIDFNIINRILRRLEVRILSSSLYRPWSWQYRFILAIIRHRVCLLEQYGECTLW